MRNKTGFVCGVFCTSNEENECYACMGIHLTTADQNGMLRAYFASVLYSFSHRAARRLNGAVCAGTVIHKFS